MKLSNPLICLLFFLSLSVNSQDSGYLFPINPGQRNYLAGTHAELRSNHFHGGLDIRTGGQIGLPVYATKEGYISRIKISPGGYGHVLYMLHPDGNTSVYGHLNEFEPELEQFVRNYQYENESYSVQIFPEKDEFYYDKGDVIAFSGNSGSSSGPHLHFEIRDPQQKFIDPLLFGFTEIVDNMQPVVKRVAFKTLDENARVNGAFGRYEFSVIYIKDYYTTRKPIELSGNIGMEILHYDYMDGSWARNGIPEITAVVDEDTVFQHVKDTLSFGLNRHMNVHIDYPTYAYKRTKFNKLYIDDGNKLDIYKKGRKSVYFEAGKEYELKVFLKDRKGNVAQFKNGINNRRVVYGEFPNFNEYYVQENIIQFKGPDSTAMVFTGYKKHSVSSYMKNKSDYYFLWDLRKGLPDSIDSGQKINPHFKVTIPPGYSFEFYNSDFDIKSYRKTLFDTLYLTHHKTVEEQTGLEIFAFDQPTVPFQNNITITLKPEKRYSEEARVFSKWRDNLSYVGGDQNSDGSYTFNTRSLGTYTISYDSIPPVIVPYSWSSRNLRIKIFDEDSGIKHYRAELNGEFLLMQYDAKRDMLIGVPKIPNTPLKGEFILRIEDYFGNKNEIKRTL